MKTASFILSISTLFLLLGCQDDSVSDLNIAPDLSLLSSEEAQLVSTANDFSFDLFRVLQEQEKDQNLFFSPFSVDVALHMTANGATGDTKTAMQQTLRVAGLEDETINTAVKNLAEQLAQADTRATWTTANSIWFKDKYTLQNGFSERIQNYYDGRIEGLDFDDPEAKDVINGWVESHTQGKIKDVLDKIEPIDVMFLVNAVYFQADWQYQFDASKTQEAPFYLEDGTQVSVPMMFSEGVKLRSHYDEQSRLLEIPYGNGQFTMVIVLPQAEQKVEDIISGMTAGTLATRLEQADTLTSQLYLPKFKLEFKTDLVAPLTTLGMGIAFGNGSSFGGFFQENIGGGLYISRVIHQAFIDVNEAGSEAAAATVATISFLSINAEPQPASIRVDRPFVFMIREQHTGAVLFAGKMMQPGMN